MGANTEIESAADLVRLVKALQLLKTSKIILGVEEGDLVAEIASDKEPRKVRLHLGNLICSCPDYKRRRIRESKPCKHGYAFVLLQGIKLAISQEKVRGLPTISRSAARFSGKLASAGAVKG